MSTQGALQGSGLQAEALSVGEAELDPLLDQTLIVDLIRHPAEGPAQRSVGGAIEVESLKAIVMLAWGSSSYANEMRATGRRHAPARPDPEQPAGLDHGLGKRGG